MQVRHNPCPISAQLDRTIIILILWSPSILLCSPIILSRVMVCADKPTFSQIRSSVKALVMLPLALPLNNNNSSSNLHHHLSFSFHLRALIVVLDHHSPVKRNNG